MLIDCESCSVRDLACGDCVVGALLDMPAVGATLDAQERTAIDVLAASGLVPPLRLAVSSTLTAASSPTADDDDEMPPAVSA